jgi:hypothetical protein
MQQQQRTWVMAAAGTMESCAMILRGVHPWRLARPSKPSVLGCIQLPCAKAAGSSDHTSDQRSCSILWLFLLCWWRNILHRQIAGTIDDVVGSVRATGTIVSFTNLPRYTFTSSTARLGHVPGEARVALAQVHAELVALQLPVQERDLRAVERGQDRGRLRHVWHGARQAPRHRRRLARLALVDARPHGLPSVQQLRHAVGPIALVAAAGRCPCEASTAGWRTF